MHIALTGPIDLAPLRAHLPPDVPPVHSGPSTGWLARTWLEQGHRLTVTAMSSAVTERSVYHGDGLDLVVVPMRPSARHRGLDFFRHERRLLTAALRDHPADVVSAHWTYEFALAAIDSGLPSFVTARDTPLRYAWEMRSAYRWLRHSMALPAVHRATALSANSPYTARHLRRVLGVRRPIEVIPNGVRMEHLPAATAPPDAAPVFATAVQGWGPHKNTATLLRAFALVRDELPSVRLLLCGDGHDAQGPARQWAAARGLTPGVEFAGPLSHDTLLRRIAAEAHALVHPSRIESFSMITAEAMGMGLPVVVGARSGAVPWVAGDGGLAVDVNSPAALADAMGRLARDPRLRARLAAAGRSRTAAWFDLRDVAAAYTSWFTKEGNRP
ncbi:glycosyltransferase family 4 protein [Streptomyces sp. V1I6]|uniref:glycosyltransferase family 4 protein n=1 Tax=Streptomyces sp. V1I6 TaxID=3042273 RepID=UPI00277DBF2B|nr:glycosyltransferase family 4 protein [Streptomyces sp. V1I6]MDQ0844821.1 glycosyltransferase involved in cell wall biosynthesis [Streptomyces sp. V1I6]